MRVIFADAGYWIALLNPQDDLHVKAVKLARQIQPALVVTSEAVLVEVLNHFSKRGKYLRLLACGLVDNLRTRENTKVVAQTRERFDKAMQLYKQHLDKAWSYADCDSFQIMKELGIFEALTYDRHFMQSGFVALMREGD